ncbi:hypothetical protein CHLNCDRAFT_50406 [Chlorella variabilis]|uniref:Probable 6-phosphogluconolactonase n=1 Tax=Chlorella variabilis TaxID=554065 RepID=E1Z675_CHLVA|nr:hypothetical protein CHLNCDRAFT_50406 [Chlorella variabilis]EFN58882.1 hypothetical protein CHLNCDRAFT_50406 [Chlorella variabilis]|eukprot:XP_005850984.1 hypothetical protein CHLNCDRAFT_50406 [Chlorella variabilis]
MQLLLLRSAARCQPWHPPPPATRPPRLLRPALPAPSRRRQRAAAAAGRYEAADTAAGSVVVEVCQDEAAVAQFLCDAVEAAAVAAVEQRGAFTLAIPGGSVLKALNGLAGRPAIPWDRVRLFFVNHKTVPNDDAGSSYAKARELFLDAAGAPPEAVVTLTGSDDAEAEAAAYGAALAAAAEAVGMERAPSGAPRFDMVLLGVGADGHVGSLYPGGRATDASGAWVLAVTKAKPPASITLSLGVMNAARRVVVCLTGANKANAAKLALETPVPAGEFPAQLVQPDAAPAVWLLDEAAAAKLDLVHGSPRGGMLQSDGSILYSFSD